MVHSCGVRIIRKMSLRDCPLPFERQLIKCDKILIGKHGGLKFDWMVFMSKGQNFHCVVLGEIYLNIIKYIECMHCLNTPPHSYNVCIHSYAQVECSPKEKAVWRRRIAPNNVQNLPLRTRGDMTAGFMLARVEHGIHPSSNDPNYPFKLFLVCFT